MDLEVKIMNIFQNRALRSWTIDEPRHSFPAWKSGYAKYGIQCGKPDFRRRVF